MARWENSVSRTLKVAAAVALFSLLVVARLAWNYLGTESVASESVKYQLGLIGSSIYEYHSSTGRWPAKLADLAQTSLPVQSYNWKLWMPPFVIVWHDDLKPNPKDNAGVVLAYHNKGLLAELGRKWVLWGDLRTEYVKTGRLRALLDQQAGTRTDKQN